MKKIGKLVAGILGISFLVESGVAASSNFVVRAPFPNTTSCFPFEDPGCCVDYAVCECTNGTFFAANKQYGAESPCNPPSSVIYGNDVGSIPGSCC